ncbi:hypothetical protein ACSBR1_006185 [Camellia fascicularis]
MDEIDEFAQLADSMRQASTLLADEDVDENSSSSRRPSTFLNVIALCNTDCDGSKQIQMGFKCTDLGAALVNLETGVQSWVFRCKSNILSLQLDHSVRNFLEKRKV